MEPQTRQALLTALSAVVAVLAAFYLELDNPWWAAISTVAVSHGDRHQLLLKSAMRMVATVVGIGLGFFLASITLDEAVLQAIVLFVCSFFANRQRFLSRFSYAWMLGVMMILMMMYVGITDPSDLRTFAYGRILEVTLGVIVVCFVNLAIPGAVASPTSAVPTSGDRVEIDRIALMAGTMSVLLPLLWSWLELPSLIEIAVTILVMLDRDVLRTRWRAGLRILGCVCGGAMGLFFVALQVQILPLWALMFFFGIFFFARIHHGEGRFAYLGYQGILAMIFTMVTGSGPPDSIMPVVDRFSGIFFGVLLVVALSFVFAPPERAEEAEAEGR